MHDNDLPSEAPKVIVNMDDLLDEDELAPYHYSVGGWPWSISP